MNMVGIGICFHVVVFDIIVYMEIQEFWNIYTSGLEPAELVWRFGKGDAESGVKEYIRTRPAMYGILCRNSWKDTFRAGEQYNRERVAAALLTHLELTRDNWESLVKGYAVAEAETRQAERKRAEAEALAIAVARVEAEARAKAIGETISAEQTQEPQQEPVAAPPQAEVAPAPQSTLSDHSLYQARTQSDAEAIAAAMARVEAEAQKKAEAPTQEETTEIQPAQSSKTLFQIQPPRFASAFVPEHAPDHGLAQARTQADAEAIAAAMARIEAEARKKAGGDTLENGDTTVVQRELEQNVQETADEHNVAGSQKPAPSPPGSSTNL